MQKLESSIIDAAFDAVLAEEKNDAERYDPFALLELDESFDTLMAETAKENPLASLQRSETTA